MFNGEPARVMHEEYDAHSGEVHTYIQASQRGSTGIKKVIWESSAEREMIIRETRRSM